MIIDAHTHTYPETIAKRAIEKLEKNSGTKAHTNGVQSGLMASMKEAGISYSLLLPVATSKKQVDTINFKKVQPKQMQMRYRPGLIGLAEFIRRTIMFRKY